MRLFLDANVLFAVANSGDGRAQALFRLAERGHCALLSSEHAIAEATRNLKVKSPRGAAVLEDLLQHVERVAEGGHGLVAWAAGHGLPEDDAPILAAAASADADLLVTGDRRHFGHLFGRITGRVRVMSLAEGLDLVLGP